VGTAAAHKRCEFQKYWLKESPLWGEKIAKFSNLGVFPTGNPQTWANWGQIWQVTPLPKMITIGAAVCPCRAKNQKVILIPAVFCQ